MFAANLLLALAWMAMTARFDSLNLLLGLALGFAVLVVSQAAVGTSAYVTKSLRLVRRDTDLAGPPGHRGHPPGGTQRR
jgi:multisubunit Na+/H+ antiporter MnhE subunit